MQLYHFTAPTASCLGGILTDGFIETTYSKVDARRNRFLEGGVPWSWGSNGGPLVVWLTDDVAHVPWREGPKTRACFTVETSAARHWPVWAAEHGIDPDFYRVMDDLGLNQSEHWYVVPRRVVAVEITEIRFALPGEDSLAHVFSGPELVALFQSRDQQRALGLPEYGG